MVIDEPSGNKIGHEDSKANDHCEEDFVPLARRGGEGKFSIQAMGAKKKEATYLWPV